MKAVTVIAAVIAVLCVPLASQQIEPQKTQQGVLLPTTIAPEGDRLFFDEVDGVHWARGNDFKASFSNEAMSFIPFFGSDAPRSFPVTMRLDAVEAGGIGLTVERSKPAVRSHREISIDRGVLIEIYDVAPGQVEQLFRFDRSPGDGDVVVRLSVETDLVASETADGGLQFSNERGAVRYSRAEVVDASGRKSSMESSLRDGAIELKVPAAFMRAAAFPVTIDPTLSHYGLPQTGPVGSVLKNFSADVAYDLTSDFYAVVYEEVFSATDHDIFLRLYDTLGNSAGGAYVDFTGSYWAAPKIANNNIANQFLVVAEKTLSGGATVVFGRTVLATVNLTMGAQFQISGAELGNKHHPDVGGDPSLAPPTYYCVTWQSDSTLSNVYYNIVQSNQTVNLSPSPFLGAGPFLTNDTKPAISKSNGNGSSGTQDWVIVYQRTYSPTDEDIYGSIIHWNGSIVNAVFPIDTSFSSEGNPAVSSVTDEMGGVRRWLAVHQRLNPGNPPFALPEYDIQGVLFTGSTAIAEANLTTLLGATPFHDQTDPCVDSDGCRFTIGFTDSGGLVDLSTPYLATVHVAFGTALGVTEFPVSVNGFTGPDEGLRITSKHSGGGVQYRYMAVHHSENLANGGGSVHAAIYDGWSAAASAGPSSYLNTASPGCGGLNLSVTGFPALGLGLNAALSGVQGTGVLLFGAPIPPVPLCTGCLLGVDPTTALIVVTNNFTGTIPCEGGLVNLGVAIQGVDLGSSTGCGGAVSFSLSQTVIVTIL